MEASGIVIVATGKVTPQPSIAVTMRYAHGSSKPICTQVVPDTGAHVCVARPKLMGVLGIPHSLLKCRGDLRDVANMHNSRGILCGVSEPLLHLTRGQWHMVVSVTGCTEK